MSKTKEYVCVQCGFVGKPRKTAKGSILIELVLWLFFILLGLIYSLWRLSSKYTACPKCGSANIIPTDSPMGQKLVGAASDASSQ